MDRLISEQDVLETIATWIKSSEPYDRKGWYLYDRVKAIPTAEPRYCDRNICLRNEYNGIGCDECEVTKSQEPSGDLISREELLKAIDTWDKFGVDDTNSLFRLDNLSLPHYVPYIHYDDVVKCIKGMPSVNPQICEDTISRKALKHKLQEHHDFFVNAYGGFSNLPQNDKSRVDEILNCIAMVVNEPSVKPQEPKTGHWINPVGDNAFCECCGRLNHYYGDYCKCCGARMQAESENKE